ncbi:MAG TPA: radical SAM protein [Candidatus Hydrogenedentes bacterium]|nr:radical SAM protein [Candidatus Hydrogenedentota bacterium]
MTQPAQNVTPKYRRLFGPVLSRRLGRSLGVDMLPFKTCTYNCVYCEQGRTTRHTTRREEYVPVSEILAELDHFLSSRPAPDYVTLSGAGEPTLHARLGDIVEGVKIRTNAPLAVLTNGSLLWDAEVREALRDADLVLPSLDAGNARLYERINRPAPGLPFEQMLDGLSAFRDSFRNAIWLEVMLMEGINAEESEVREIADQVWHSRPDRVQLNTVARPPAESFAVPVSRARLETLAALFSPRAEVIADYSGVPEELDAYPTAGPILELLKRRPCPVSEIAVALGLRAVEVSKLLQRLLEENAVVEKRLGGVAFFAAAHGADEEAVE